MRSHRPPSIHLRPGSFPIPEATVRPGEPTTRDRRRPSWAPAWVTALPTPGPPPGRGNPPPPITGRIRRIGRIGPMEPMPPARPMASSPGGPVDPRGRQAPGAPPPARHPASKRTPPQPRRYRLGEHRIGPRAKRAPAGASMATPYPSITGRWSGIISDLIKGDDGWILTATRHFVALNGCDGWLCRGFYRFALASRLHWDRRVR